jgi:tetratricopeptide (TPR) repeat protein
VILHSDNSGKVKLGLVLFIVLLALVIARFVYRYADRASLIVEEAKEFMTHEKYDTALSKLDEALAVDPKHVPANYHRGICLAERHRFDEAVEAFDRVILLDPKRADAYFNKGKVFWYQNRFEEAVPPFEKATELHSKLNKKNQGAVWLLLGLSLYELHLDKLANDPETAGHPAKALAAFKTYLAERPGAPDKSAVRQKIDILENPGNELYKEAIKKRSTERKAEKKKSQP